MRHAKSSWSQTAMADHDRPLNKRGYHDAPDMAIRLLNHGPQPELILCSSAARAIATADYLRKACKEYNCQPDYQEIPELYLSSPDTMLNLISQQSAQINHIVVVAHNPGMEDLSEKLAQSDLGPMPTAAIRQFSCGAWNAMHPNTLDPTTQFTLQYNDFPKNK